MDFEKIIPLLIREFKRENVKYALIGGFSLGVFGIMRSTMDLDFLVDANDLSKIGKIMEKYDYKCVFKTENVSQYVSGLKIFGEIDFLHAFRKTSLSMFKRASELTVLEGKCRIKVLSPEDIIGLKLQALVNDSSRKNREYDDIESIMRCFGKKLDWKLISEHFSLFEMQDQFDKLKAKYGKT